MLNWRILQFLLVIKMIDGLPTFETLCPYSKFCGSTPLKNVTDSGKQSCCQQCSCADDCTKFGNCCPTIPTPENIQPIYPCTNLIQHYRDLTSKIMPDPYKVGFHIIDDCPRPDDLLSFPGCYLPTDLQDFAIVSDMMNERVFKNKHCAICNGVNSFVSWDIIVEQCIALYSSSFNSIHERDRFVKEKCPFYSLPPNSDVGKAACEYRDPKVTSCETKVSNQDIKDACLDNRTGTNSLYFDGPFVYANVYCYMCNKQNVQVESKLCDKTEFILGTKNTNMLTFSAILTWTDKNNVPEEKAETGCSVGDIYDHYCNTCRPLICPGGFLAVSGRCKSILNQTHGLSIQLKFELDISENVTVDGRFLHELAGEVTDHFLEATIRCGECKHYLVRAKDVPNVVLIVVLYSTGQCTPYHLLNNAHLMARHGNMDMVYHHHNLNRQPAHVSLRLILQSIEIKETLVYTLSKTICINKIDIDRTILEYCPGIQFLKTELSSYINVNDTDAASSLVYKNDTVFICWRDYTEIQQAKYSNSSRGNYHKINSVYNVIMLTIFVVLIGCQGFK